MVVVVPVAPPLRLVAMAPSAVGRFVGRTFDCPRRRLAVQQNASGDLSSDLGGNRRRDAAEIL